MPNTLMPQQVSLDLAGTGNLVEVTKFIRWADGVQKTPVRTDQFRDTAAATWTCVFENYNGWATPGNAPTMFAATTLAALSTLGATSISTTASIPAGSYIVIDAGSSAEVAQTGTPSGSGPFTIPIAYTVFPQNGLLKAHSNGVAVVPMVPLTERMDACWSSGGELRKGSILTMGLSGDNWDTLTVTFDDMLGAASRNTLGNLAGSQVMGASPYLFWPLNDPASSGQAAEVTGNGFPLTSPSTAVMTLGVVGLGFTGGDTQMQATGGGGPGAGDLASPRAPIPFNLPAGSLGFTGAWVTPVTFANTTTFGIYSGTAWKMVVSIGLVGGVITAQGQINVTGTSFIGTVGTATVPFVGPALLAVGATYAGTGPYTYTFTLYINGVAAATNTTTGASAPPTQATAMFGQMGALATDVYLYSHFWYAPTLIHEEWAGITTEANRLMAIDQTTSQVTLAALPSDLSTAPIGYAATSGQSALDAFNVLNRTEQGYLDCTTTGTLFSATQTIRVRARQRPATVDAAHTFDAQQEIMAQGAAPIPFIRDSTNLIWSDAVTGANSTSQTVSQTALQARAGSNNSSDTVDTYVASDLFEFGSDRLWRGANVALRPESITIDNLRLATDRSADLTALAPGDRVRINNIPSNVLGITSFDGWLLDVGEDHRSGVGACDLFTLYLQPCQPLTGIFDTDLFENGGNNLLTTAMTAVTTSAIVGSVDGFTWFEQSATGYYIQIDSEVMKVTAAAAPSGGNQTLTVTRAQNSTTAATHAIGALPEIVANPSDVANNGVFAF